MSLKRRRGLILSRRGWERLQEAERLAIKNRQFEPHTLQELSDQTGLSQNTLDDEGLFASHLRRQLGNLQPDLIEAMRRVVSSDAPVTLDAIGGPITLKGQQVIPSCDFYRHYFAQVLTAKTPCRLAIA